MKARRTGFTLIEMLVVITIIAFLVSLLSAAVVKILAKIADTTNVRDIRNLSLAITNFKAAYSVDYLPSRIILCENSNDYYSVPPQFDPTTGNLIPGTGIFKDQLNQESYAYINQLWRGMVSKTGWAGIDWNNNGVVDGPVTLEGHECLVFFLGGMQDKSRFACLGFSTSRVNPTLPSSDRVPPFFEFEQGRLQIDANGYFSYKDAYKTAQPYAYFSSYKKQNNYNRYGGSDCASLGVQPYFFIPLPAIQYENADTWQIISAGRDGKFGPGGEWSPLTADTIAPEGRDDMSNFHTATLGTSLN